MSVFILQRDQVKRDKALDTDSREANERSLLKCGFTSATCLRDGLEINLLLSQGHVRKPWDGEREKKSPLIILNHQPGCRWLQAT